MFYLTTHSTHLIYGYIASDIWLRTILIVRKETTHRTMSVVKRISVDRKDWIDGWVDMIKGR